MAESTDVLPEDDWPEAPWDATYHRDEGWWGWQGHGWTVPHAPPGGFPFVDFPLSRALYGPPGTAWVFTEADLLAGLVGLPGGVGRYALNRALRKFGVVFGSGPILGWRTPEDFTPQQEVTMRWTHVTIIGTVGTTEQVAHTFNFRTHPVADVDQDPAAIQTFAGQVRDAWVSFINNAAGNPNPRAYLASSLAYTEVRAAYLEQTAPASITTEPGKTGPRKVFHYPRPTYLVPTQYALFTPGSATGGGTTSDLPWEVAAGVTLTSGFRGARNRGRVFLGPLSQSAMAAGGLLSNGWNDIATQFGTRFVNALNTTTGQRLHVVSRAYATSVGVNGVSIGHVPDSQRRRRRSQPEAPFKAWQAS